MDQDEVFDEPGWIDTTLVNRMAWRRYPVTGQNPSIAADPSISGASWQLAFQSTRPAPLSVGTTMAPGTSSCVTVWRSPRTWSVWSDGTEEDGASIDPEISSDGGFVAFQSDAFESGGPSDGNGAPMLSSTTGSQSTERMSLTGDHSSGSKLAAFVSGDGSVVAFTSEATNLIVSEVEANGVADVFVHDRYTSTTARVSEGAAGEEAQGVSSFPSVSGDGRFVAFRSLAPNLVAGDTNGLADIFLHDRDADGGWRLRRSGRVRGRFDVRVSVASDGSQGSRTTFEGGPRSPLTGATLPSRARPLGWLVAGVMAGQSGIFDVFVHDRVTGMTSLVSVLAAADCTPRGFWETASIRRATRLPGILSSTASIACRSRPQSPRKVAS